MTRTYENAYSLVGLEGEEDQHGHTLYTASKALAAAAARGVLRDGTHVRRNRRCVAFWSNWHESYGVRAMFGAFEDERELVNGWSFQ